MPAHQVNALKLANEPWSHSVLWVHLSQLRQRPVRGRRWVRGLQSFQSGFLRWRYVSPVGLQSYVFCGLISQEQVLKVAVSEVPFKPSAFQGEAPGFEFPAEGRLQPWCTSWRSRVLDSPPCCCVDLVSFAGCLGIAQTHHSFLFQRKFSAMWLWLWGICWKGKSPIFPRSPSWTRTCRDMGLDW